jgi:diglucosylglycerate octanoyltransferase
VLKLVVLGDSTAFYGDRGPLMPSDPVLYPNVVARALQRELGRPVTMTLIAQPGSDTRTTWRAVSKEPHVKFDVLMGAEAVVVGLGSFDHAPMGVPPSLEALVPYLRPSWLRRNVRTAFRLFHPWGVRLTRGRFTRTPPKEFERLFDSLLVQVRGLTRGAAGVVMGPVDHRSSYYGGMHPKRAEREELQFEIARRHGFATLACWPLVEPYAEKLNSDGIHWPPDAHEIVGEALAEELLRQFRGALPRPGVPSFGAGDG